ncbi:HAMP domain-containing histidine kinase [Candidatus Kaiserbacteria bacterium]|nr:HAMP domain-containing histidine kinase [Candidatus Kaiserbacteria bacterium]
MSYHSQEKSGASQKSVLQTGSKITRHAHHFASIILLTSLLVATPILLFVLNRFTDLLPMLTVLGVLFLVGSVYYFLLPSKKIPPALYLFMDYFFLSIITILFLFADPQIGVPILFFYMVIFVVIDSVAYGWRDAIIILIGASGAVTFYNMFHAVDFSLYEAAGLSVIQILVLTLLTIDMRILTALALSEEKRRTALEAELERYRELEVIKSQFLAVASHQMRTPLSEARWALHELETRAALDTPSRVLASNGHRAIERLVRLVDMFLSVASADSKKIYFNREEIFLPKLISEIIQEIRALADNKSITLEFKPSEEFSIEGDRFLLKEALSGVIENGIRYTEPQGKVSIAVARQGESALITVKDTGIGMDENDLGKLFQKFYRSPRALKMHTDGSGLALFYAKSTVEQHGGAIEFESALNRGTTVSIKLPLFLKRAPERDLAKC